MAHKSTFKTKFRRRIEGKTDYKKRLALVKSKKPRLVVRKSNKYILAQVVEFASQGDKTIVSVSSKQLNSFGWKGSKKNIPSAYLTGLLCGVRVKEKGIEKAILDIGFSTPVHGSIPFAALKGAIDAGLNIPFDAKALPSEERVAGKHIEAYANSLDSEKFKKIFSGYAKQGVEVKKLSELFEKVKKQILKEVVQNGKKT